MRSAGDKERSRVACGEREAEANLQLRQPLGKKAGAVRGVNFRSRSWRGPRSATARLARETTDMYAVPGTSADVR